MRKIKKFYFHQRMHCNDGCIAFCCFCWLQLMAWLQYNVVLLLVWLCLWHGDDEAMVLLVFAFLVGFNNQQSMIVDLKAELQNAGRNNSFPGSGNIGSGVMILNRIWNLEERSNRIEKRASESMPSKTTSSAIP